MVKNFVPKGRFELEVSDPEVGTDSTETMLFKPEDIRIVRSVMFNDKEVVTIYTYVDSRPFAIPNVTKFDIYKKIIKAEEENA